jgi:phosphoribosylaminoimidazole-succinocarboxamide synthase
MEFGFHRNELILIDELLTPDSSRFWPAERYAVGENQLSFDKQYVRDFLESIQWNKRPPAPVLPEHVILETSKKYIEAYERLTGREF